jgi:hypothetical protein
MTSDLVNLTRLDVSLSSDGESYVQRTSACPQPGMRHITQEVRWQRKCEHLGGGTFGQVYLEKCMEIGKTEEKRAVKTIKKIGSIDYKRELEALAVLSYKEEVKRPFLGGLANY